MVKDFLLFICRYSAKIKKNNGSHDHETQIAIFSLCLQHRPQEGNYARKAARQFSSQRFQSQMQCDSRHFPLSKSNKRKKMGPADKLVIQGKKRQKKESVIRKPETLLYVIHAYETGVLGHCHVFCFNLLTKWVSREHSCTHL